MRNKFICILMCLSICIQCFSIIGFNSEHAIAATVSITNGIQFKDTSGNIIHAHGGGLIKYGDYYYWYGEYRDSSNYFLGVRCYRSTDLKNWEYRGEVLDPKSATELNKCNVERPKVMYNASTKQFVMWMHWENGVNYGQARAAVAYCNTPDGKFTYHGSFRPMVNSGVTDHGLPGYMSRDCNVFVDTDGTGYFISSSNENMDLHLYKLTPDYKGIASLVTKLFVGKQREAPCLIKRNNYYYLITSGCTGWDPNQGKYAYSTNLASGWSDLYNLGDSTTYNSQPAYIIPVQGTNDTSYLYTGDRWAGAWGGKVNDSKYVWLPLIFESNTSLKLPYSDSIQIDAASGTISYKDDTTAPDLSDGWGLVFSDDFDGTSLNTKNWNYNYPWGNTHTNRAYCAPENVSVANGVLKIKGENKRHPNAPATINTYDGTFSLDYTSGAINTDGKFNFTAGYIEGRFKIPGTLGFWPSFFTLNSNGGRPPEIDIFEILCHEPTALHTNYHYGSSKSHYYKQTVVDLSKDFHTYAVEWDSEYIKWYLDGKQVASAFRDSQAIAAAKDMYLIINLAVGGWETDPSSSTDWSQGFECDWVRVWQKGAVSIPEVTLGDINNDKAVDSIDFALLKKHLLGDSVLSDERAQKAADVSKDGTVDAIDFALLKKYLLKAITEF